MAIYTREQVIKEIQRHAGNAHPTSVTSVWDEIDSYYKREADIVLPELVTGSDGDADSLARLFVHTNYAKTIVNSTVTMVMASGLTVRNAEGITDRELSEKWLDGSEIRRLIRHTSRYGGAWLQIVTADKELPYRVYKPHVARRIMEETDQQREHAVLVIQEYEAVGDTGTPDARKYKLARWYEWNDDRSGVTLTMFRSNGQSGTGWELDRQVDRKSFPYMPWIYVPNHHEDSIPEQSDVIDGLEIFKQYDALRVKFLKALEDESFRLIFLASVGDDVAKAIKAGGGLQFWYAKNAPGEPPPELQSVPPADQRQFLDGLNDLIESLAVVTRTSVLELGKIPVQDIPAQTLRVLYGPQIERCQEVADHINYALTRLLHVLEDVEYSRSSKLRAALTPRLPISEDKIHQNAKGLLDADAYSAHQMLRDDGYTDQDADKIIAERYEEKRKIAAIETEQQMQVDANAASAQADGQIKVNKEAPPPAPAAPGSK